ncbi:MAG: CRISPR-associated protein Cas4 [Thermocladium sp.]|jgi:CRISPR-associated protein Cas4
MDLSLVYPLLRDVVRVSDSSIKEVMDEYVKSVILFFSDNIVVIPRQSINASPSMVSSYDFCPYKAWIEHRYGIMITRLDWIRRIAFGEIAHKQYQDYLKSTLGKTVISEMKIEDDDVVGKPDIVVYNDDDTIDILELKTGKPHSAHEIQVLTYVGLLDERVNDAEIIYMNSRTQVNASPERISNAIKQVKQVKNMLSSATPPQKDCGNCPLKGICKIIYESPIIRGMLPR